MSRLRETKIGLDYFSHDVDLFQDPKVKLLKAKHGFISYGVYLRLLENIYSEHGYYLQLNEDVNILFCDDNNLDYNVYISILNECIRLNLFNGDLFKKYSILTSKRIQLNYIAGTQRRKEIAFYKELLLVNLDEKYNVNICNVNILTLNANILTLNANIVPQIERERERDIDIDSKESIYCGAIKHLNITTGKKFRLTPTVRSNLSARVKEGATLEDIKTVIDKKYSQWSTTDMQKYLRPPTLFGTKFDSYLNEDLNDKPLTDLQRLQKIYQEVDENEQTGNS